MGARASRREFAIPGAEPQYAPDRPFRLESVALDVTIDPRAKTLEGVVTQKVRVVTPGQSRMVLDQMGLEIQDVSVAGKKARWERSEKTLTIDLPEGHSSPKPGDTIEFAVKYRVADPRRGLYFTGPDADYPSKPFQVWSQGQDEDNRYWFPTFDYPNQKARTEVVATVPKGFMAISNGALLKKEEKGDQTRYHYKLAVPHVTYLITLVVAEFSHWAEQGPKGIPVEYFVEKGREADGKRAFSNTPKMIEVYSSKLGLDYPYEKYSQAAVQDFIFGGMENTSATTQTDLTLHDERAHLDFSSDGLVSHELAHQWFGNLLTCRDWSHAWLNEGFATFMERVWIEGDTGPNGGFEEAKYYSYQDLKEYMDDDAGKYRRAIVCNTYIEPMDLFDTHLYQKGGLVLNLLRHILGEEQFWASIRLYVQRHREHSVETLDLIRAIEDATGRNLRRFFDEWVFGAGHPELEVKYAWDEDKKRVELVIEQKQTDGKPKVEKDGATTHLFHLPVEIELTTAEGVKTHRIELASARERVFLSASSKPLMARFDRDHWIPKSLKFPRPKEMLLHQLSNDKDCMGRIEAVKELAKVADRESVAALAKAAAQDPFWGVQAEAAHALAEIRGDAARDGLIAALPTKPPKARRAIANALGKFHDAKAEQALKPLAQKDASYYVEAEATSAWASARGRPGTYVGGGSPAEIAETEKFLLSQLSKPSYREVIRAAALRGLAELPGVSRGERPGALEAIIEWTGRGKPMDARGTAIACVGRIAKSATPAERARQLSVLMALSDEDNFRIRMALVAALRSTEAPEAAGILEKVVQIEVDGRVKRGARVAIDELRAAGSMADSVASLKTALERLEEEHRKLKDQLAELKAVSDSPKKA